MLPPGLTMLTLSTWSEIRSRLRLCRAVERLFFVYSAAGGQGPRSGVCIGELSASNRGLFCVLRKQCAEKQPYPSTRLMR